MFVRRTKVKNGATAIRIVETVKVGKKYKQRLVKHVGQSKDEQELVLLEQVARTLMQKLEPSDKKQMRTTNFKAVPSDVSINDLEEVNRYSEGVFQVFGKTYNQLGLNHLIKGTRKDDQWNEILRSLVLLRLSDPTSKRESVSLLDKDYGQRYPLEKIYRAMDKAYNFIDDAKEIILNESQRLSGGEISCLLYDVTTLYFESFTEDGLREFGFSKDCKFKEVQIVLSLFTNDEGLPIGYKVFPGKTSEGKTLLENLKEVKEKLGVSKIKLFADRAMFTWNNLEEMERMGIKYVVAAKLKSLKKSLKDQIVTGRGTGEDNWKNEYDYDGRRLIVSYSSDRAKNDQAQRQRLIERLLKKEKGGNLRARDLISNQGTKKYINVTEDKCTINREKIEQDEQWDGLHGVITNDKDVGANEILSGYRRLWKIEEVFRISKTDLKMRPIYHWKKERIETHILICYLALAIGKFTLKIFNNRLSLAALVKELSRVEVSIYRDKRGKISNLIAMPSPLNSEQRKIYAEGGVSRPSTAYLL